MVADDLFLDSLFSASEKTTVDSVEVVVGAPRRTADLVRRLARVRRGNTAMRQAGRDGTVPVQVRTADRLAWLRAVVLPQPHLAPAGVAVCSDQRTCGAVSQAEATHGDCLGTGGEHPPSPRTCA